MLEVDLSEFNDFPIEYNKLEESDFMGIQIEKIMIEPNSRGFISNAVDNNIVIETKNSVAINCAVGQGKSYSIVRTIERFYEATDNYLIFVASPFVTLVNQYYSDICNSEIINEDLVYHYDNIRENNDFYNSIYTSKKIHVISTNLILNNPGEDAFFMNERKETYIQRMIDKATSDNLKVVIIYDEIHDTIHNFKQELIFNLFRWKDVLHKNIILSATYNESSKIVLGYLAELTDRKLKILESERTRKYDQSELYLHFDDNYYTSNINENSIINEILEPFENSDRNIDVLCCYKSIAENLYEGIFKDKFGDNGIRLCVAGINNNSVDYESREIDSNRYNPEKINIGTNFKTGVSIHKENHTFIIILPPKQTGFKKYKGVFSDGVLSVIQAFARQRVIGKIHVILPSPKPLDYTSIPFDLENHQMFKYYFDSVTQPFLDIKKVEYLPMTGMKAKLTEFYHNKKSVYENLHLDMDRRRQLGLQELPFPSYESIVLDKGERYLSSEFNFYGKDLSTTILYNALTDQYVNCKLKNIDNGNKYYLDLDNLNDEVFNLFYEELVHYEEVFFNLGIDNYEHNINHLYNNFKDRYKYCNKVTGKELTPNQTVKFNQELLAFVSEETGENVLSNYLIGNLKFHAEKNEAYHMYARFDSPLISEFYTKLDLLIDYYKSKMNTDNRGENFFFLSQPEGFYNSDIAPVVSFIKLNAKYILNDYLIYTDTNFEKKFYKLMVTSFFRVEKFDNRHIEGIDRKKVYRIIEVLY